MPPRTLNNFRPSRLPFNLKLPNSLFNIFPIIPTAFLTPSLSLPISPFITKSPLPPTRTFINRALRVFHVSPDLPLSNPFPGYSLHHGTPLPITPSLIPCRKPLRTPLIPSKPTLPTVESLQNGSVPPRRSVLAPRKHHPRPKPLSIPPPPLPRSVPTWSAHRRPHPSHIIRRYTRAAPPHRTCLHPKESSLR